MRLDSNPNSIRCIAVCFRCTTRRYSNLTRANGSNLQPAQLIVMCVVI
jgi:hypothetical protein